MFASKEDAIDFAGYAYFCTDYEKETLFGIANKFELKFGEHHLSKPK